MSEWAGALMANPNPTHALKKLRGRKKWTLIRHLATEQKTQQELADLFEVSQPTISAFRKKHAEEIDAIKADLENEFAGMWIADKRSRIEEYEAQTERITEWLMHNGEDANLEKVIGTALRSVAEEMGQLPTRVKVDHGDQKVHIVVEGADTDKLT